MQSLFTVYNLMHCHALTANSPALTDPVSVFRVADELFVLIRDLAAVPSACIAMIQCGAISRLAYFANPEGVPQAVSVCGPRPVVL